MNSKEEQTNSEVTNLENESFIELDQTDPLKFNNQTFLHALTEIIRRIRGYEITNPFTFYFKQIFSECLLLFSHLVVCIFKTFILILIFNPSHTERVLYLDLVTSMFVVCFR